MSADKRQHKGRGKTEREQALDGIIAVLERKEFIQDALAGLSPAAEEGVRRYVARVVRGVTERAPELDQRIASCSTMKLRRMHPVVRNVLRLGAYEIYYMDSIPAAASVNECVALVRKKKQLRAAGMVNAILRRLASDTQKEEAASTKDLSMPEWIYEMWAGRFGTEKADAMCASFLKEKALVLRGNDHWITREELEEYLTAQGADPKPVEGIPMAFACRPGTAVERFLEEGQGRFYIQDAGSIEVMQAVKLRPGDRVLDCCGAPGGKSIYAANRLGDTGLVESRDRSDRKVALIRENIRQSRFHNMIARRWDATVWDPESEAAFDVVLADVPCSGLGVLGRKPEINYRLRR